MLRERNEVSGHYASISLRVKECLHTEFGEGNTIFGNGPKHPLK
jgi:hypothetical protein